MTKGRKRSRRGDSPPAPPRADDEGGEAGEVRDHLVRTCAVTRTEYPREQLLRFVVDPEGRVMEDLSGRLPGRGVYLHPTPANVGALLKHPAPLTRMAGGPVQLPQREELLPRLDQGLRRRLLEGVGLARRAGMTRFGLDELLELLVAGKMPSLIVLAGDTAINTREKLARMLARQEHPPTVVEVVTRALLGAACGHKPVAVLSILAPGVAKRVEADARRWMALQGEGAVAPLNRESAPPAVVPAGE